MYWVTQKLPQICTVILRICIGKVAWFAVYIFGNFWVTQYSLFLGYLCFLSLICYISVLLYICAFYGQFALVLLTIWSFFRKTKKAEAAEEKKVAYTEVNQKDPEHV